MKPQSVLRHSRLGALAAIVFISMVAACSTGRAQLSPPSSMMQYNKTAELESYASMPVPAQAPNQDADYNTENYKYLLKKTSSWLLSQTP